MNIATEQLSKLRKGGEKLENPRNALLAILFLDWTVFVLSFSLNHVFRPDILAIAVYFSFYFYLWLTKRWRQSVYIIISSVLAALWMYAAGSEYGYNRDMWEINGLELFPLFAWSAGLAGLFILSRDMERLLLWPLGALNRFFSFSLLYLALIISLETIAYHIFDIRNLTTSMYSGLPICDCIHAPVWMQSAYLLMGPSYYLLCLVYDNRQKIWHSVLKK